MLNQTKPKTRQMPTGSLNTDEHRSAIPAGRAAADMLAETDRFQLFILRKHHRKNVFEIFCNSIVKNVKMINLPSGQSGSPPSHSFST